MSDFSTRNKCSFSFIFAAFKCCLRSKGPSNTRACPDFTRSATYESTSHSLRNDATDFCGSIHLSSPTFKPALSPREVEPLCLQIFQRRTKCNKVSRSRIRKRSYPAKIRPALIKSYTLGISCFLSPAPGLADGPGAHRIDTNAAFQLPQDAKIPPLVESRTMDLSAFRSRSLTNTSSKIWPSKKMPWTGFRLFRGQRLSNIFEKAFIHFSHGGSAAISLPAKAMRCRSPPLVENQKAAHGNKGIDDMYTGLNCGLTAQHR